MVENKDGRKLKAQRQDASKRFIVNNLVPKAGPEPARLAAPPPQDGVSANSTTSAKCLLLFRRCWGRSVLLGRRLLDRRLILLLLGGRLLRLISLRGAFANDGRAAGP